MKFERPMMYQANFKLNEIWKTVAETLKFYIKQ